ncbi:MAG: hypothetical protein CMF98_01970 [Candidatus Marinimicrobia bacterium]|nr:hypothetical protein [Candidatus Neomarinimicrobiota bacterium]OUW50772.1 MAG: hypothetical protein CBD50_00565 [bacterium TMED190]
MILTVDIMEAILFFHFFLTFFMTGIIWLIQLIHYPSFSFIDKNMYSKFQTFHMNRISFLVGPIMILELLSGFYLLLFFYSESNFFVINFILNILILTMTIIVFGTIHKKLIEGFKFSLFAKLISMNWIRTILWSMKSIFIFLYKLNIV